MQRATAGFLGKSRNPPWPPCSGGEAILFEVLTGQCKSKHPGELMAEVKSTLEIALEKANALEVSSKDREQFKREEALSKATSIFRLYTQHPQRLKSLSQAIEDSGTDATLVRQCLREVFLKSLGPHNPSDRIWEGLQELGLQDRGNFQTAFSEILEDDARARQEVAERVNNLLRDSLSKTGISGTAVDPNIEKSPHWEEAVKGLDQNLSAELDRLRQKIVSAIERRNSSLR